ncbi:hypothetical protein [Haloterrigena salinisoli]|uniref:hypothetical protein n=1 Tax=Haloterrigena salinisoli TaxID=3132747 RepID=UPI0030D30003
MADVFGEAERKARIWFGISAGVFIVFGSLFLGFEEFFGITEVLPEFQGEIVSDDSPIGIITRILSMLLELGKCMILWENWPGIRSLVGFS